MDPKQDGTERRRENPTREQERNRLLRDAADALVWAITALVEGTGQGGRWPILAPGELVRPSAWAIGNDGLAGAPHLYTDY